MLITCPKCSMQYEIPEEVHLSVGKKMKCSNCQHVFVLPKEAVLPAETEETSAVAEVDSVSQQKVGEEDKVFADTPVFQDDVPQPFVPVAMPEVKRKNPVGTLGLMLTIVALLAVLVVGVLYRDVLFETLLSEQFVEEAPRRIEAPKSSSITDVKVEPVVSTVPAVQYVEETPEIVALPQIQSVRFEKKLDPVPTIRIEGILKNTMDVALRLPTKVRAVAYNAEGIVLFEKDIYLTDAVLPAGEERPFFGSYQPAPEGVQWVDVTF